jgi:FAD/FMN-containing dehydrogenase
MKQKTRLPEITETHFDEERGTASLPNDHLEQVAGWGEAYRGVGYVYRPVNVAQVRQVFQLARAHGRTIGIRGGGNSYGDAALNDENIVLDLRRMNRVLDWDAENGRLTVEPGVTLQRVWEYTIEDGWWVPVATGTMKITVGGGAAMNVHGKNAWKVGTFGEHVEAFDLMLPSGEIITCSREQNSDIFQAAIGGFGMLGVFTSLTLRLKRIYSGLLNVEGLTRPNLHETMAYFDEHLHDSDYLVAWLDAFSGGKGIGRSEIHRATHLRPGEDPQPTQTLRLRYQHVPPDIMGFFPRSALWRFQVPFWNNLGMRFVNMAKYYAARRKGLVKVRQSHGVFHFLLDSMDWKRPFGKGGLIQYQPFIPAENAERAFTEILRLGQQRGLPNFLTVLKRHKPDPFLISYGVDGYSLAMDWKITEGNRTRMVQLTREMDEIVLANDGRFYFAKDSVLRPEVARAYLGEPTIAQFHELKHRCDPDGILETNLWRRVFG